MPGDIPGNVSYRLKRRLARGGMGAIFEAEQIGEEGFVKTVALKTILPEYTRDPTFVEMFISEAKLAADLVHQNIVQIYHLGRHDERLFIAMEYIDGVDLAAFLERHREQERQVPVELAAFIASRVCRGLEYAHSRLGLSGQPMGIVHRDVSPRNIMITKEGEVKIGDFGVAKAAREVVEDEGVTMLGKIGYMSPEQAMGLETDARSDIFSLGAVSYELLTGERPFAAATVFESLNKLRTETVKDPRELRAGVSDALAGVVMRCLEREPDRRFATSGDVGYALEVELYSKGYGPTIVTLGKYMANLYPERTFFVAPSRSAVVEQCR